MTKIEKVDLFQIHDANAVMNIISTQPESLQLEYKKSDADLSHDIWETVSAFANTSGGLIILGVDNTLNGNIIVGVHNPQKQVHDFQNTICNPSKVSRRCIIDDDIAMHDFGGKTVIVIRIRELNVYEKPLYLNDNKTKSYIRFGEGDRLATDEEYRAMIRNSSFIQDSKALVGCGVNQLDSNSLEKFKREVLSNKPTLGEIDMPSDKFLLSIGLAEENEELGSIDVKLGTLLLLGKVSTIQHYLPHYHVDYFSHIGSDTRWSDRVSDDDFGIVELNLFNFFNIVYEKLITSIRSPFKLNSEQIRVSNDDFKIILRESLVNTIVHADYHQEFPSIKIDAYEHWVCFINPGKMLVTPEQFLAGGESRPRNTIIMKGFRLLGLAERQGFGGLTIVRNTIKNVWRYPDILTDLTHTELKVWNIDLADSFTDLTDDEKKAIKLINKADVGKSLQNLKRELDISEYKTKKIIDKLLEQSIICKIGNGPSTAYVINNTDMQLAKMEDTIHKIRANAH